MVQHCHLEQSGGNHKHNPKSEMVDDMEVILPMSAVCVNGYSLSVLYF